LAEHAGPWANQAQISHREVRCAAVVIMPSWETFFKRLDVSCLRPIGKPIGELPFQIINLFSYRSSLVRKFSFWHLLNMQQKGVGRGAATCPIKLSEFVVAEEIRRFVL
jgi:hypothetical protein